ncbi:MAG TPA: class I SAM-dependent methyltransferase [Candidatus Binatus sp.]|jgi:SAM-dependent methyltransferase|nr:class I SAM-dependent methyltransferase [Candidatus Binatus sp.]
MSAELRREFLDGATTDRYSRCVYMLSVLRKKAADLRDRLRGRDQFDASLGVDTSGIIRVVDTKSPNRVHGARYQPCNPENLRWAIESAHADLANFDFADIGCGKGRALVVASKYPFRRLIGVDYSLPFVETARENLKHIGASERSELHCQDAVSFRFKSQATFLFLYNPFSSSLLDAVLLHLRQDVLDRGFPVIIIYQGPRPQEIIATGWAEKVDQRSSTSLFFVRSG